MKKYLVVVVIVALVSSVSVREVRADNEGAWIAAAIVGAGLTATLWSQQNECREKVVIRERVSCRPAPQPRPQVRYETVEVRTTAYKDVRHPAVKDYYLDQFGHRHSYIVSEAWTERDVPYIKVTYERVAVPVLCTPPVAERDYRRPPPDYRDSYRDSYRGPVGETSLNGSFYIRY